MKLQGKRVLVTGADGFIGSHLVEHRLEGGANVRAFVFDNSFNSWGWLDTLDEALVHLERARALAPDDDQAYVLLGAAYQSAGRSADAITAYERYLALAPDGKFARDVRSILKRLKR